ncbi:MAG: hypothetical protein ACXWWC_01175 [Chitinophagaceae bacterium]
MKKKKLRDKIMSSLQNKMYNYEVTPPVNSWERIAAALDNAKTQNEFSSRLYNIEATPPANIWEKIVDALDNSKPQTEFSSRLYNIEVHPPAATWEKIAATLAETRLQNGFPSRLYNMEIAPRVNVWKKIVAGINQTGGSASAPVRKILPILRYAAAAIFIGAVAFGIIKLSVNTGDNSNNSVVSTTSNDSNATDINKAGDPVKIQTPEISASEVTDDASEKSNILLAKPPRPGKRLSRSITSSLMANNDNNTESADTDLSQSLYAYADHIPDIADRYVMLMTPDGNIIRMSKKWGNLLCCVSGEEQDADCKNQLKKWQEKIASSSLAPSPGNFMDILGLVNSLNEDNGL